MFPWAVHAMDLLWRNALTVVPLALAVALFCRCLPCRPATRHTLWLIVLLWFLAPPGLSERHLAQLFSRVVPQRTAAPPAAPALSIPRLPGEVEEAVALEKSSGGGRPRIVPEPVWAITANEDRSAEAADVLVFTTQRNSEGAAENRRERKLPEPNAHAARAPERRKETRDESNTAEREGRPPLSPRGSHVNDAAIREFAPLASDVLPSIVEKSGNRTEKHNSEIEKRHEAAPRNKTASRNEISPSSEVSWRNENAQRDGTMRHNREKTAKTSLPPSSVPNSSSSRAPANAPSAPVAAPAPANNDWRPWLAALGAVRDAVGALPPLPLQVWLGGIAAIVLLRGLQFARFRYRLRRAVAAPEAVVRLVTDTARAFGLRRIPGVWMLPDQVSPMIWCGRRTRLLLPLGLWQQLDAAGRRAVVCHELAHLRRRDHWVRRLEWVVGALFWWHPVAWWARRQLNEEAELCCDAWVTWLLPQGRRAYAQALLNTKRYISESPVAVPAAGLGVTSVRAQRFARRITMVMTQSVRPKASIFGLALAALLLTGSWLAAPVWARPQDKKAKPAKPAKNVVAPLTVTTPALAPVAVIDGQTVATPSCNTTAVIAQPALAPVMAGQATTPVTVFSQTVPATPGQPAMRPVQGTPALAPMVTVRSAQAPAAVPSPVETIVQLPALAPMVALANPGDDDDGDDDKTFFRHAQRRGGDELAERLARLERVVERLAERVEQLAGALEHVQADDDGDEGEGKECTEAAAADDDDGDGDGHDADDESDDSDDAADGEIVVRSYRLPQGKLEALGALMIRDDVPIRVAPREDRIEVHATEEHHEIFKAFLEIIDPSDKDHQIGNEKKEKSKEKSGKTSNKDAKRLMEYAAALKMKEGHAAEDAVAAERALREVAIARDHAAAQAQEKEAMRTLLEAHKDLAVQHEKLQKDAQRAMRQEQRAAAAQQQKAALDMHAAALEEQARAMEAQIREIEQKIREMEGHARDLESKAEDLQGDARKAVVAELKTLHQEIKQVAKHRDARMKAVESERKRVEDARRRIEMMLREEQSAR